MYRIGNISRICADRFIPQESTSSLSEISALIAVAECFDPCDLSSINTWSAGTVLYDGPFNPQFNSSAPMKGLYQDFRLQLPGGWATGQSVILVAHQWTLGVSLRSYGRSLLLMMRSLQAIATPLFDFSVVSINVVD